MELLRYLRALTQPFFRWWWALLTGVATLLSFFQWQQTGVNLSGVTVALSVCAALTLLFFAGSVITQGFGWYTQSQRQPVVVACTPADKESPVEIFHLTSALPLEPGQVISLLRTMGERVFCIGMLKVERIATGRYQCVPLWIAAGPKQELKQGKIPLSHLSASLLLNETDLLRFRQEASA